MPIDLQKLLRFAVKNSALDVHLQAGSAPMLRLGGQMRSVDGEPLSDEDLLNFIGSIAPNGPPDLAASFVDGLDFSYAIVGVTRFRCSASRQLGPAWNGDACHPIENPLHRRPSPSQSSQ